MRALGRGALAVLLLALIALQPARASEPEVQTIWRLLDYVAVDYPGAVSGGKVVSPLEYAEMTEFAAQVETRLKRLPQKTAKPNLVAQAAPLRQPSAAKSAPPTHAVHTWLPTGDFLARLPLSTANRPAPRLPRRAVLYCVN